MAYDYSTINRLKKEIIDTATTNWMRGLISKEEWEESFTKYEKAIGENVDKETFLAHEYSRFDVYVDVTELLCTMQRCFPDADQRWILLKIGKFILADEKLGCTKCPRLNHNILKDCIKDLGMSTNELLGLTLA